MLPHGVHASIRFLPSPPGAGESPSSAILAQIAGKTTNFDGLWASLNDALEVGTASIPSYRVVKDILMHSFPPFCSLRKRCVPFLFFLPVVRCFMVCGPTGLDDDALEEDVCTVM